MSAMERLIKRKHCIKKLPTMDIRRHRKASKDWGLATEYIKDRD
jgi:hypothetical protein